MQELSRNVIEVLGVMLDGETRTVSKIGRTLAEITHGRTVMLPMQVFRALEMLKERGAVRELPREKRRRLFVVDARGRAVMMEELEKVSERVSRLRIRLNETVEALTLTKAEDEPKQPELPGEKIFKTAESPDLVSSSSSFEDDSIEGLDDDF